jgi:hypothetical protein
MSTQEKDSPLDPLALAAAAAIPAWRAACVDPMEVLRFE